MNNSVNNFSFNRLSKLLKRDLMNYNKKAAILSGIVLFIYIIFSIQRFKGTYLESILQIMDFQYFITFICLFIVILPLVLYLNFSDKRLGVLDAMLPASNLEKFLSKWLVMVIIYPILFIILSFLLDFIISLISGDRSLLFLFIHPTSKDVSAFYSMVAFSKTLIPYIIISVLYVQAMFFLGVHIFRKNKISKSIIITIIWSTIVGITLIYVSRDAFGNSINMNAELTGKMQSLENNSIDMYSDEMLKTMFNFFHSIIPKSYIVLVNIVNSVQFVLAWLITFFIMKIHQYR
ncbi:MAG: hypothetical protein WCS34_01950 [Bacteroidales bacterium]